MPVPDDKPSYEQVTPFDSSLLVSVIAVATTSFKGYEKHLEDITIFLRERYAFFEVLLIGPDSSDDAVPRFVERLGCISPQVRYLQVDGNADFDRMAIHGYQECIGDIVVLMSVEELPVVDLSPILKRLRSGKRLVRLRRWRGTALERLSSRIVRSITGLEVDTRFFRTLGLTRQLLSELIARPEEVHLFRFTAHKLFGPQTVIHVEHQGTRGGFQQLVRRIDLLARLVATAAPRLLRFASAFCLAFSGLALASLVYVVAVWLLKREVVEGWTTIISLLALWMFVQSSGIAVLCLGLSRVLDRQERSRIPRLVSEMTVSGLFKDVGMLNVEAAHLEPEVSVRGEGDHAA